MDWNGFNSLIQFQLKHSTPITFHPSEVTQFLFDKDSVGEMEFHRTLLDFCNQFKLQCITVIGRRGPEAVRFWSPEELVQALEELPDEQGRDDSQNNDSGESSSTTD